MQYFAHLSANHAKSKLEEVKLDTLNLVSGYDEQVGAFNFTRETIHIHRLNGARVSLKPTSNVNYSGKVLVRVRLAWSSTACLRQDDIFKIPSSELTEAQQFKKEKILEALSRSRRSVTYEQSVTLREIKDAGGVLALPGVNRIISMPDIEVRDNDWPVLLGLDTSRYTTDEVSTVGEGWFICGLPETVGLMDSVVCSIPAMPSFVVPIRQTTVFEPGLHIKISGQMVTVDLGDVLFKDLESKVLLGGYRSDHMTDYNFTSLSEFRVKLEELRESKSVSRIRASDAKHKDDSHRATLAHSRDIAEDKIRTQAILGELKLEEQQRGMQLKAIGSAATLVKGIIAR